MSNWYENSEMSFTDNIDHCNLGFDKYSINEYSLAHELDSSYDPNERSRSLNSNYMTSIFTKPVGDVINSPDDSLQLINQSIENEGNRIQDDVIEMDIGNISYLPSHDHTRVEVENKVRKTCEVYINNESSFENASSSSLKNESINGNQTQKQDNSTYTGHLSLNISQTFSGTHWRKNRIEKDKREFGCDTSNEGKKTISPSTKVCPIVEAIDISMDDYIETVSPREFRKNKEMKGGRHMISSMLYRLGKACPPSQNTKNP
jgi:hypothetical protein